MLDSHEFRFAIFCDLDFSFLRHLTKKICDHSSRWMTCRQQKVTVDWWKQKRLASWVVKIFRKWIMYIGRWLGSVDFGSLSTFKHQNMILWSGNVMRSNHGLSPCLTRCGVKISANFLTSSAGARIIVSLSSTSPKSLSVNLLAPILERVTLRVLESYIFVKQKN